MKIRRDNYWITYVEVNNEELYPCEVWFDSSPPEPDIGFGGAFEIECVEHKGKDITSQVSADEMESLAQRTIDHLNACAEDSRY